MRYRTTCTRITLLLILLSPLFVTAQDKKQEGLLWRITGNGLVKPSYLFGTIHLTDKRVFNFGDSLYAALENSDGYAMELDPDSMMVELFKDLSLTENAVLLKDKLKAKDYTRMRKKLEAQFKKPADQITSKEFTNYFNSWALKFNNDSSMQTIMDAYLYNAARRMGKWVGGIEDVADQSVYKMLKDPESYITEFMADYRNSKRYLENMVRVYTEDDITIAEKFINDMDGMYTDSIMLKRNRKMTYRIDSLAHARSTFFAIGTAHLPGDSGVIAQLIRRGFTLQPVISSKRIPANDYRFKVVDIPWVKVQAASGLYTVDMPGEPQKDYTEIDDMDMKLYADVTTNLFYMTMGVSGKVTTNEDSMINALIKNIYKKSTVTISHAITRNEIAGKDLEAEAEMSTQKIFYRIQVFYASGNVYMAVAGAPIRKSLHSTDVERFFRSFAINRITVTKSSSWKELQNSRLGFTISMPGKPTLKEITSDPSVSVSNYSYFDLRRNIYFQCAVQNMGRGYHLDADSSVFANYIETLKDNEKARFIGSRPDSSLHYPAMWIECMIANGNDSFYNKIYNVHRGNRIYALVITVRKNEAQHPLIDSFFRSFALLPNVRANWSLQQPTDKSFSTWGASTFDYVAEEEEATPETGRMVNMYDSLSPVSYFISRQAYSPYYWISSDSLLFRNIVRNNSSYPDSLLSYEMVTNGTYRGAEVLVRLHDNHNLKKMRFVLAGDTVYTLFTIAPAEVLDQVDSRRFFEDFRVIEQHRSTTLFTNKVAKLTEALLSPDSAVLAKATEALNTVTFTEKDLPALHHAMLQPYQDSAEYYNTNTRLFNIVSHLNAEQTVGVVQEAYPALSPAQERLRYELLALLSNHKTERSYQLLKTLMLQRPPRQGPAYKMFNNLVDSLQLTATIIADLLPLLKDSLAADRMLDVTGRLIDSNLLDVKLLLPYHAHVRALAARELKKLQINKDTSDAYDSYLILQMLGRFKDPAANQAIRKYLLQENEFIKYHAVIALIRNGQAVPPEELLKLAKSKEYRLNLYGGLKELNKLSLFPKLYLNNRALAESELYGYATDDDYEPKKIDFIGERIVPFKGSKQKFYLYRIDMSNEEEKLVYLGVAGPFAPNSTRVETEKEATGIMWAEEYDAARINDLLKKFLEERSE